MVRQITVPASFEPGTIIRRGGRSFRAVAQGERGTIFTEVRGGRRAARFVTREDPAELQRRSRVSALLTQARGDIQSLPVAERIELQRLQRGVPAPRIEARRLARLGVSPLSRQRRLLTEQQRNLTLEIARQDTTFKRLESRQKGLEQDRVRLQRLSDKGLLQIGVAAKFRTQISSLSKEIDAFNSRQALTSTKISRFETKRQEFNKASAATPVKTVSRVGEAATQIIPKRPTEAIPFIRELEKEKRKKEEIQRPFGLIDVRQRISETRKAGMEFGAAAITPGAEVLGARAGAVAGTFLGTIEAGALFAIDRPLFELEKFFGKPLKVDVPSESIFGRTIRGTQRVPVLRDITGVREAKQVTKETLEIRRPFIREFGVTTGFIFGPQIIRAGAKTTRAAAKLLEKPVQQARFTAIIQAEKLLVPKLTRQQAKTFGILPSQVESFQFRRLRSILPSFEESLAQRQLADLKQLRRAQRFEKDIDQLLRERRGEFLPRRRPRAETIQIQRERPELRIKAPELDPTRFIRRERSDLFAPITGRTVLADEAVAARSRFGFPSALAVASRLSLRTVAASALTQRELLSFGSVFRDSLRSLERQARLERTREVQRTTLRGITGQRARFARRTTTRQLQQLQPVQPFGSTVLPRTATVPRLDIRTVPRVKRTGRKRPPPLLLPELELGFIGKRPKPRKVQGFNAFVKEKPFKTKKFRKVTKVPLPRQAARERGFFVADQTIAQSVKIRPAKRKVPQTPAPLASLGFKFDLKPKRNVFIEKRSAAIDTPGEVRELTVGKFLAEEKRRGLGLFGAPPKRRKRRRKSRR